MRELALDRPFDPAILKKAGEIAAGYRLVLEPDEDVGYIGCSLEMPLVFGDGETPDACVRDTRDALVSAIATMLEKGQTPPQSGRDEIRNEQINIRVTSREKMLIEGAAHNKGFRGASDFLRTTALAALR